MKRTARYCVSAGCLLLLIALFFGFKKTIVSARTLQSSTFTFDSRASAQFQGEVGVFTQQLDAKLAGNSAAYCDSLKKQFPLIASLQAELSSSGAFVAVEMAQPVCFINDDIVIAAPGIKGSPQSYDQTCVAQLPRLVCSIEYFQSWHLEKLCAFARALSCHLLENYDIALGQYPEVNLVDKQRPRLKLQARADLFNVPEIVRRAQAVTALLSDRGVFAGKKQRQWTADMRFVQQIIIKVN